MVVVGGTSVIWDFTPEDKPFGLICHGHSISEFIENWDRIKKFDILWCSLNDCGYLKKHIDINLYIYIKYTSTGCERLESRHFLEKGVPRGNSPLEFICQCNENGVKRLFLFGADGFSDHGKTPYYYGTSGHPNETEAHRKECDYFNNNFPKDLKIEIFNVSPDSKYHVLNNITYEDFYGMGSES